MKLSFLEYSLERSGRIETAARERSGPASDDKHAVPNCCYHSVRSLVQIFLLGGVV